MSTSFISTEFITIADSTGISSPNVYSGSYGVSQGNYINYPTIVTHPSVSFASVVEQVQYTIYKLIYKLSYTSSPKELVFAYQSDEAPELGIMKAADRINLKFIEILSLQELETSIVFLLSNQKIKEIEL